MVETLGGDGYTYDLDGSDDFAGVRSPQIHQVLCIKYVWLFIVDIFFIILYMYIVSNIK